MLKRFLHWLWPPTTTPIEHLLETIINNQDKTTTAMFNAMSQIGEASQKQAEVLNSYLKLFQGAGEPERHVVDPIEDNTNNLIALGFPMGGTEKEQADWAAANWQRL